MSLSGSGYATGDWRGRAPDGTGKTVTEDALHES